MAVGPKPNLPPEAQPWARWVSDQLRDLGTETVSIRKTTVAQNKSVTSTMNMASFQRNLQDEIEQELEEHAERMDAAQEALDELNELDLPQLALDLEENAAMLEDLEQNVLPGLEAAVTAAQEEIDALDDVVAQHTLEFEALEQLPSELAALGNRLNDAEDELGDLDTALDVLNNTTLPGIVSDLQEQIDNIEVDGDGNTITTSTSAPPGTSGYSEGDQWRQVIGTGSSRRIVGEWYFSGTAWIQTTLDNDVIEQIDAAKVTTGYLNAARIEANSIVGEKIAADSITGNKILAGSITANDAIFANGAIVNADIANLNAAKINAGFLAAERIAGNSITAEKLLVGSGVNLIPGVGRWGDPSLTAADLGITHASVTHVPAESAMEFTGSAGTPIRSAFTLEAGITYHVSLEARNTLANTRFYLQFVNQSGQSGGSPYVFSQVLTGPANSWNTHTTTFTPTEAQAGAFWAQFYPNHNTGTQGGVHSLRNLSVRAMTGATLIENGAVTSDKVAANAITAGKINANAVTTAKIAAGAVNAAKIAAGAIIAEKIGANQITGEHIAANSITANDAVFATGAIQNADIGNLVADKITSGTLRAITIEGVNITGSTSVSTSGAFQITRDGAVVFEARPTGIRVGSNYSPNVSFDLGMDFYSDDPEGSKSELVVRRITGSTGQTLAFFGKSVGFDGKPLRPRDFHADQLSAYHLSARSIEVGEWGLYLYPPGMDNITGFGDPRTGSLRPPLGETAPARLSNVAIQSAPQVTALQASVTGVLDVGGTSATSGIRVTPAAGSGWAEVSGQEFSPGWFAAPSGITRTRTADFNIGTGTVTIPLTSSSNAHGWVAASGNGAVINQKGVYTIYAAVQFDGDSPGIWRNLNIAVNGTTVASAPSIASGSASRMANFTIAQQLNRGMVVTLTTNGGAASTGMRANSNVQLIIERTGV